MTTQIIPQNTVNLQAFFAEAPAPATDIQIGTDLPLTPAEVSPTATLAELRAIKAHWLNIAEQTGDLKTLLLVTRELGQELTPTHWTLTLDNTTADLNVTGFQTWRDGDLARLTVTTTDGHPVCQVYRTARRIYTNPHSGGIEPLYIPGPWMDAFRTLQPQAEASAVHRYQAALEADRQALLAELGIPSQPTPAPQHPHTPTPAAPAPVIVQPLATPANPTPADPFIVDGFEITRLDFILQADGEVIVQKLAQTPVSRGNHVILNSEKKPVDLKEAATFLRKHGYTTRRWEAVHTATVHRPAGMRAWKADQPWPIRTEGQIRKLRAQLGQLGHSLNLAFDL